MNTKRLTLFVALAVVLAGIIAFAPVAASNDTASSDCAFPVTDTDATDTEVTVDERPDRIVTLQPSTTQIVWDIGASDRVVGAPVGEHIAYLDGHGEPVDITQEDGLTPSVEQVVDVEPDLVLAAGTQDEEQIQQLREANITVFKFETPESFDALYDVIERTGRLTGECEGADETLEWMTDEIDTVEEAVEGQESPLAFYPMGSGFTAGEGTFTDEIITTAGGENLGSKAGIEFYEVLSQETIVEEDPEWIVHTDSFDEPPVEPEALEATTAWEEDQVLVVNASYMNQPGPRIVYPLQEIAEAFHPEAYADAQTAESETTEPGADDETPTADQQADAADEPMSGFGVGVALLSVLLASLLALRRR